MTGASRGTGTNIRCDLTQGANYKIPGTLTRPCNHNLIFVPRSWPVELRLVLVFEGSHGMPYGKFGIFSFQVHFWRHWIHICFISRRYHWDVVSNPSCKYLLHYEVSYFWGKGRAFKIFILRLFHYFYDTYDCKVDFLIFDSCPTHFLTICRNLKSHFTQTKTWIWKLN